MTEQTEKCQCGNEAAPEHSCPFAKEIHDSSEPCVCCADCEHECAMDV